MSIKQIRENRGISQVQLSNILAVVRSTIAKWETGMSVPRAGTLKKLAAYFGCTIDELLTDDTERRA